jgi:hypothetical protein
MGGLLSTRRPQWFNTWSGETDATQLRHKSQD